MEQNAKNVMRHSPTVKIVIPQNVSDASRDLFFQVTEQPAQPVTLQSSGAKNAKIQSFVQNALKGITWNKTQMKIKPFHTEIASNAMKIV